MPIKEKETITFILRYVCNKCKKEKNKKDFKIIQTEDVDLYESSWFFGENNDTFCLCKMCFEKLINKKWTVFIDPVTVAILPKGEILKFSGQECLCDDWQPIMSGTIKELSTKGCKLSIDHLTVLFDSFIDKTKAHRLDSNYLEIHSDHALDSDTEKIIRKKLSKKCNCEECRKALQQENIN